MYITHRTPVAGISATGVLVFCIMSSIFLFLQLAQQIIAYR